jgi:predicted SAM-dependent methyltransferase
MLPWLTLGVKRAAGTLREEIRAMRRHRGGVRRGRAFSVPAGARLQLGSGRQPKPGWINVDLYATAGTDFALDLREDLPFPDNSFDVVYAEHLFEHLDYPRDARHLLAEALRVLKPDGTLSLVVPHCGELLQAYAQNDKKFFEAVRLHLAVGEPTLMHHVNYWFRQDGHHRYAYDEETLGRVMSEVGFVSARVRPFDPELDSATRQRLHSLYMDARKPIAPARS